jgi:hypothetical protein
MPVNRYAVRRVDLYRRDTLLRTTLKTSFVGEIASAALSEVRRIGKA